MVLKRIPNGNCSADFSQTGLQLLLLPWLFPVKFLGFTCWWTRHNSVPSPNLSSISFLTSEEVLLRVATHSSPCCVHCRFIKRRCLSSWTVKLASNSLFTRNTPGGDDENGRKVVLSYSWMFLSVAFFKIIFQNMVVDCPASERSSPFQYCSKRNKDSG